MAALAVAVGEIAALNHKVVNDPVEDGAVVVPVLDEEFEVLNVNRSQIRVQLDGDRPAVGAAVPLQLKVNNIGRGVGPVDDVDHRQHEHTSHENGDDARRGRRSIVEQAREGGFADALVLHLVEKVVVEAVGLLSRGFFLVDSRRREAARR